MNITTHQAMYLCLFTMPFLAYCYTYGVPMNIEQFAYALLYTTILAGVVLFVFSLTLVVFGLPIPNLFQRNNR